MKEQKTGSQMIGKIVEVFDSVQGEGLYLGVEQLFVRFFGCNLSCGYCDTKTDSFMEYEPDELLEELKLYTKTVHSISFTGGEPLVQAAFLKEIMKRTHREGYRNYLETNGTLPEELESVIASTDIVAMDLKLPSATGGAEVWAEHERFLRVAAAKEVFLKSVISLGTVREDIERAIGLVRDVHPAAIYVLQPNSYDDPAALNGKVREFQALCQEQKVTACVIPQMHKIMGVQ